MTKIVLNVSNSDFIEINIPLPTIRTRQRAMYDENNLEFIITPSQLYDTLSKESSISTLVPVVINSKGVSLYQIGLLLIDNKKRKSI
jgi:hypothetical protein